MIPVRSIRAFSGDDMSSTFDRITELKQTAGPDAALDALIETLRSEKNYHRLFDALLMKRRHELGLPLLRPTSLQDVPADIRPAFEEHYIHCAREVGSLFLADGQISEAWLYFRTIQEPQKIAEALERMSLPDEYEKSQELINIALYEGAHPIRGLEWLLRNNGTCNTITTLGQMIEQLKPEDRQKAAAIMVRHLYAELRTSVQADVSRRMPLKPGAGEPSLRELIFGRDWLFQDGNYHIDVSHLNSVVRFARFLAPGSPELDQAVQLAEYGTSLDPQFQYPSEAPFDDFYPAHVHFLSALAGRNVDEALAYFQHKLEAEPDDEDRQMIAYVLVDLLVRIGQLDKALAIAEQHLRFLDEATFSFADLCVKAGRKDAWAAAAKDKGDLVGFTAAIVQA